MTITSTVTSTVTVVIIYWVKPLLAGKMATHVAAEVKSAGDFTVVSAVVAVMGMGVVTWPI